MSRTLEKLLLRPLPFFVVLLFVFSVARPAWAQEADTDVVVKKPAAEAPPPPPKSEADLPPPLTPELARQAAVMAVAFDRLPRRFYSRDAARVSWLMPEDFRVPGVRYDRFSALYQIDGKTYAGVDIAKQEGRVITLQGFEMETPESPSNVKVKVVEKDAASTKFFTFDMEQVEKDVQAVLADLKAKDAAAGGSGR